MRTWTAILLSLPVALGLVAWAVRPATAPPRARVERPVEVVSAPAAEPEIEEVPMLQAEDVEARRRNIEQAKERERLLAEFDARIRQLIESIDWTRADSRVRFPVEHDRIKSEYDRALVSLQD